MANCEQGLKEDTRAIYLQALATVQQLILLGERYIPCGPPGAYAVIGDIMRHVTELESQTVRLRAAILHLQTRLDETEGLVQKQNNPLKNALAGGPPPGFPMQATDQAANESLKRKVYELEKARDEAEKLARMFPKVTL